MNVRPPFPRRVHPVAIGTLADAIGGTVHGDASRPIDGVRGLQEAGPGDASYCTDLRHAADVHASSAGAVLVPAALVETLGDRNLSCTLVSVMDPSIAYARLAEILGVGAIHTGVRGVHPTAVIARGVRLGRDAAVGAYVVIGEEVCVGDRCVIGPGVVIEPGVTLGCEVRLGPRVVVCCGTRIGDRVVVQAGAVLGSEGFGYVRDANVHRKIPQRGELIVGDDVEIGANTTIDRGSSGPTEIGRGTKIDNLVQVGHNVQIGERCLLAGQAGVAGSSILEADVVLAGQAGVADHVRVGAGAVAAAQAGITGDIEAGATVSGYPALPHSLARRVYAARKRLPEMLHRIAALEDAVRRLTKTSNPE